MFILNGHQQRVHVDSLLPAPDCVHLRDVMNSNKDNTTEHVVFTCVNHQQVQELLRGHLQINPDTGDVLKEQAL